jgi:60 kDa SS-A/Ro ribonucleoprotein
MGYFILEKPMPLIPSVIGEIKMQINKPTPTIRTHEGAPAKRLTFEAQLRRSVMACMLWEKTFYEEGTDIATRIQSVLPHVEPRIVSEIAIEARTKMKLRHVPLLLVREMARLKDFKPFVAQTLSQVIQRPDELSEFLSLYWKDGKCSLSGQVKKGLARAFTKFSEYQLAKYNRDNAVKLRDVLFLCHAKPKDSEQDQVWKKLIAGTLSTPDTWEVALSSGADKKAAWERLILEKKLGGLALLRNLRNMTQVDVTRDLIKSAINEMKTERILPFRFIAAAKYAPDLESFLEVAMFKCLTEKLLSGKTTLLIDVSGSMNHQISTKSEMTRLDAACGLAMLLREVCDDVVIRTFSESLMLLPPRKGFALRDAITRSQPHVGTYLGQALLELTKRDAKNQRIIVITDEQSHDKVPDPIWEKAYMINVATDRNGVGYGKWTHIDGWSEAIVDYVAASER